MLCNEIGSSRWERGPLFTRKNYWNPIVYGCAQNLPPPLRHLVPIISIKFIAAVRMGTGRAGKSVKRVTSFYFSFLPNVDFFLLCNLFCATCAMSGRRTFGGNFPFAWVYYRQFENWKHIFLLEKSDLSRFKGLVSKSANGKRYLEVWI